MKRKGLYPNSVNKRIFVKKFNSRKEFEEFVDKMEVNKLYIMDDTFRYTTIDIDSCNDLFSWSIRPDYSKTGSVTTIFPGSGNMVTSWKRIENCKKSLKKYFSEL